MTHGGVPEGADLSEAELTRNIIGTIGEIDTYRLPDAKGSRRCSAI